MQARACEKLARACASRGDTPKVLSEWHREHDCRVDIVNAVLFFTGVGLGHAVWRLHLDLTACVWTQVWTCACTRGRTCRSALLGRLQRVLGVLACQYACVRQASSMPRPCRLAHGTSRPRTFGGVGAAGLGVAWHSARVAQTGRHKSSHGPVPATRHRQPRHLEVVVPCQAVSVATDVTRRWTKGIET